MSTRKETDHQVIIENEDNTHVWEKNSSGNTTKEEHSVVAHGERYDHYGNHIGKA